MSAPTYELRKVPLLGTRGFVHSILLNGATIHSQISPYSEDEIESRISAYLKPVILPPRATVYKEHSAKPGRRKKAAEGQTPWVQEEE